MGASGRRATLTSIHRPTQSRKTLCRSYHYPLLLMIQSKYIYTTTQTQVYTSPLSLFCIHSIYSSLFYLDSKDWEVLEAGFRIESDPHIARQRQGFDLWKVKEEDDLVNKERVVVSEGMLSTLSHFSLALHYFLCLFLF